MATTLDKPMNPDEQKLIPKKGKLRKRRKFDESMSEMEPYRRLASEVIHRAVKDYNLALVTKSESRAEVALEFLKNTDSPWHRALRIPERLFAQMIEQAEADANHNPPRLTGYNYATVSDSKL